MKSCYWTSTSVSLKAFLTEELIYYTRPSRGEYKGRLSSPKECYGGILNNNFKVTLATHSKALTIS